MTKLRSLLARGLAALALGLAATAPHAQPLPGQGWDGYVRLHTAPAQTPGLWLACPKGFDLVWSVDKHLCATRGWSVEYAPLESKPLALLLRERLGDQVQPVGVLPLQARFTINQDDPTSVLVLYRIVSPAR